MSGHLAFQGSAYSSNFHVRTTPTPKHISFVGLAILAICCGMLSTTALAQTTTYVQTNIISDMPGTASVTDPTLINPWGVSVGPAIWIDATGSGLVKVDTVAGATVLPNVTVPSALESSTHGSPSGTVYNSAGTGFNLPDGSTGLFLFGTLDGTIAAWSTTSGTQAVTVVNNSSNNASYTDIALDTNATGTYLLAADFALGTVEVFNSNFAPTQLGGGFVDPNLPAGYAPFGIHSIGGNVYVTYAEANPANGGPMVGAGLGYVDEFDNNGNLLAEAIVQNVLNAPWGMALAPAGFGSFAGDLLVGNFGDGVINAFDSTTFAFVGSLSTAAGAPIANPGLWEIFVGQGGTLGDPNTLYFAAGINHEKDGLFGSIAVAQPAAGAPSFTLSAATSSLTVSAASPGNIMVSLTPTNGFNGVVTLTCTSSTVTCAFDSQTVSLSGSSATSVGVSIAEMAPTTPISNPVNPPGYNTSKNHHPAGFFHSPAGITLSFIGPIGLLSFAGLKRRSLLARGSFFALLFFVTLAGIAGCSSSQQSPSSMAPAPASTASNLTITATSGSITQSVTIAVTAQ
jgi:uncharacterized protein (TIGR03118 family)